MPRRHVGATYVQNLFRAVEMQHCKPAWAYLVPVFFRDGSEAPEEGLVDEDGEAPATGPVIRPPCTHSRRDLKGRSAPLSAVRFLDDQEIMVQRQA